MSSDVGEVVGWYDESVRLTMNYLSHSLERDQTPSRAQNILCGVK